MATPRGFWPALILFLVLSPIAPAQSERTGPQLAEIRAGSFSMGSQDGAAWEQPVHDVQLGPFHISALPVTNAEYLEFDPTHESSGGSAPEAPVTGVSFDAARRYCEWLSLRTKLTYRLPSEARWEFAARGGLEQAVYAWGDDPPVPEQKSSPVEPAPRENAYGMTILSGNLWEWTADWYSAEYFAESPENQPAGPASGRYRVLRGGGFRDDPNSVKVFTRGSALPMTESQYITFRVVREVGELPTVSITEYRPPAGRQVDSRGIYVQSGNDSANPTQAPVRSQVLTIPRPEAQGRVKISVPPKPKPKVPDPVPQPEPSPAPTAQPSGPLTLTDIAVDTSAGGVVVTLAMGSTPKYRTMVLGTPDRLVVDLTDTVVRTGGPAGAKTVGANGITKVRWAQFAVNPAVARIVVDLDHKPKFEIESTPSGLRVTVE